ncbi:TraB/GumN family protein [Sphingomonas naphthae]|uniref:TraB/GumN family protein n=1 Tax=Sphingomonas naphthae TaxID=1813468 RepID=A0ABY7TPD5_9SPHN|nr:TraB/GumN family protein [Sphingomonas naphthae]WCT75108.1 TraB/GumN family protein [Sphingomonas naphthae]
MIRIAALAALLLATTAPAAPPAPAKPALWQVKDADTTIYLFGTVHVLPAGERWFEGPVKAAFDKADALVIETVAPPPAEAARVMMARAIDPAGRSLTAIVGPESAAKLGKALVAEGRPADMLDRFEPWYAATLLTFLALDRIGIKAGSGVEPQLQAAAGAAAKPVEGLEGFDAQLALLDGLSAADQKKLLDESVEEMAEADGKLRPMIAAWEKGDAPALARLMNEGLKDAPEIRRLLLDDRNARFADWIAARMARPGTVFLAVGAGHLGGEASVQAFLAKKGLKATRVQ